MASSLISARVVASTAWLIVAFLIVNPIAYAQTDAVVPRNHPALAEGMTPSGGLEPNRALSMSVTLALRNRDQLEQLLADQQNPASPQYHHFLTPDEFAAAQTCVGQLISPGKSCRFGVTFHPVVPGPVGPLLLTVTDNAGNSPQTISLSGAAK